MLIAKNISKQIKNIEILSNVDLELNHGVVYGFVSRNGSGLTILFHVLAGLMKVDYGEIFYKNQCLHKDIPTLPNLGITLENAGLYPGFTGFKNLQLLAKLNKKIDDNQIKKTIERVGLDPNDKRPYKKYSLDMKQRIVIAQAIMEQPDIIMLDQPTNSLDEDGVRLIRQIIKEEKQRGAMILLAIHKKEDISLLADEVYYLDKGQVFNGVYTHAK